MQKSTVLEKNDLSANLIDLKCRWLQSGLADLGKHQTFAFLCMIDFLAFLFFFERFLKIIISTC